MNDYLSRQLHNDWVNAFHLHGKRIRATFCVIKMKIACKNALVIIDMNSFEQVIIILHVSETRIVLCNSENCISLASMRVS